MRRQPSIAIAALAIGVASVIAYPSIADLARSPVPVGAVLQATAEPEQTPTIAPTIAPTRSVDPTPSTTPTASSEPTAPAEPQPSPIPVDPQVPVPALDHAGILAGDGSIPADPRSLTGYRWPLTNGRITGPFGPSPLGALLIDGQRFHDGLDIASFCGDTVMAAHDGTVLAAGRRFDPWIGWAGSLGTHTRRMDALHRWGELPITVIIDDGNGYRSIYAHLNAVSVRPGQHVRAGHQVGWEGSTGFATGCHLHYGLFSIFETNTFELRPDVQHRTRYPRYEFARIDPQRVLPPLPPGKTAGPFPLPPPNPVRGHRPAPPGRTYDRPDPPSGRT